MKITIHRGNDQIGGCVTEYEHEGWKLFVDYGEQLPGSPKTKPLEVEGLTKGDLTKSALLITHYHGDHIGSIKDLPKGLAIYIGELAKKIQLVYSNHMSHMFKEHIKIIERLNHAEVFSPGIPFWIGPFKILPINVDHSAFDAYAFKIEAGGVTVFHTGDFRTHGPRSRKWDNVLYTIIGNVDYVVCEGTNVDRPDLTLRTEDELIKVFEKGLSQKIGHIVYLSSTNIDRLFLLYKAASKARMLFLVDAYQEQIMDVVRKSDSLWSKSMLYQYRNYPPKVLFKDGANFTFNEKFLKTINERGYVMIARAHTFDKLIAAIPGEKKIYLSMWKGYVNKECEAYNEALAKSIGSEYESLHTSGHCDMNSLRKMFEILKPKAIIPIHTNKPDKFAELFNDEWRVVMLIDGQSIQLPINDQV